MMKHARCCSLLLVVLAASCVQKSDIAPAPAPAPGPAPRLDIAPGTVKELRSADYRDARYPDDVIVTVKQPSIVYVFHAYKLRAMITWLKKEQGEVIVPVGRIADTPGEKVFIGVNVNDEALKSCDAPLPTNPSPIGLLCHGCMVPNDDCCPEKKQN